MNYFFTKWYKKGTFKKMNSYWVDYKKVINNEYKYNKF
jgi:hypothetical protein